MLRVNLLPARPGFIYFIGAGFWAHPVKIGWTTDPERRLSELQVASALKLALLATRPGSKAEERELHARFRGLRMEREWFAWSEELRALVRSLIPKTLLSLFEVAEWMKCRTTAILREVRQGRLPCTIVGGEMRFEEAAVEAWIEEVGKYGNAGRDGRWERAA